MDMHTETHWKCYGKGRRYMRHEGIHGRGKPNPFLLSSLDGYHSHCHRRQVGDAVKVGNTPTHVRPCLVLSCMYPVYV